jgi:hypothetical protein
MIGDELDAVLYYHVVYPSFLALAHAGPWDWQKRDSRYLADDGLSKNTNRYLSLTRGVHGSLAFAPALVHVLDQLSGPHIVQLRGTPGTCGTLGFPASPVQGEATDCA